jgi:hypothetical protein
LTCRRRKRAAEYRPVKPNQTSQPNQRVLEIKIKIKITIRSSPILSDVLMLIAKVIRAGEGLCIEGKEGKGVW